MLRVRGHSARLLGTGLLSGNLAHDRPTDGPLAGSLCLCLFWCPPPTVLASSREWLLPPCILLPRNGFCLLASSSHQPRCRDTPFAISFHIPSELSNAPSLSACRQSCACQCSWGLQKGVVDSRLCRRAEILCRLSRHRSTDIAAPQLPPKPMLSAGRHAVAAVDAATSSTLRSRWCTSGPLAC